MLRGKSSNEDSDSLLAKGLLPIIDLAHCGIEGNPLKSVVNRVGVQLQKVLPEKGLALLVNHGIPEEKLREAWQYLENICNRTSDVDENSADENTSYGRSEEENNASGKTSSKLHCDFNIKTLIIDNLEEDPLPGFEEHSNKLVNEFKTLASFILQSLAVSLELSPTFFCEKHSHMLSGDKANESYLRLMYYPNMCEDKDVGDFNKGTKQQYSYQKCASGTPDFRPGLDEYNSSDINEGATALEERINPDGNTDLGTFTLFAQDSDGGFEVKLPGSEKWQRVGHLPGSIFIISGEILSIWTEKRYPALSHRIVISGQEHLRARGRHSIAYFCHPDNVTTIDPTDLKPLSNSEDDPTKPSKKHVKMAKEKVFNAYQIIKKKFKNLSN